MSWFSKSSKGEARKEAVPRPGTVAAFRQVLAESPQGRERMAAALGLCPFAFDLGVREAVDELHLSLMNEFSGEVALGIAYACANQPGEHAAAFRGWTMDRFKVAGDRSTSDGAPLLRLAYIAALENDVQTLAALAGLRPGDNGVARIHKLHKALQLGDGAFVTRLMVWSEGLDARADLGILEPLTAQWPAAKAWIVSLGDAIAFLRANRSWHGQTAEPVAAPSLADTSVRRDQHNSELRAFYLSLTTMTEGMLCECSSCGILLPRDGGGLAGGIGAIKAIQERPAAVAAFLLVMAKLLGPERVPNLEGNSMVVGMGLLGRFAPKMIGPDQPLCPVCAEGGAVALSPAGAAPAPPDLKPAAAQPVAAPRPVDECVRGKRDQPAAPFPATPSATFDFGCKDGYCCAFTAQGLFFAVSEGKTVRIVSVSHRKVMRTFEAPGSVVSMSFSPNAQDLLVGGYRYQLSAWAVKAASLRWQQGGQSTSLSQVHVRHHPSEAEAICQMDNHLHRFAMIDGKELARWPTGLHAQPGSAFAVEPGGRWAATTAHQGTWTHIGFPSLTDDQAAFPTTSLNGIVRRMVVSGDGKWLACAAIAETGIKGNSMKAFRGSLYLYSLAKGKWVGEYPFGEPGNGAVSVAFGPGGAWLIGGWDREVAVWSIAGAQLLQSFSLDGRFLDVAINKERQLVAVTTDGKASIWDLGNRVR